MIITWFTFFTENFVMRSYQITKNFPLWVRLHRCVICKKPSLPSSSNRYRNLGAKGFSVALQEHFHRPNSPNSCSHSGNSCDISLQSPTPLIPIFSASVLSCNGSSRNFTRTFASFGYWIFNFYITIKYGILMWRCNWGRTRWRTRSHTWYTSSICCNQFAFHFGWDVVFDRLSSGVYTHDPHRVSPRTELREFLQEAYLWQTSPIAWHTQSLLLWFAPRRWPSSDFLMSSWSPTQQN